MEALRKSLLTPAPPSPFCLPQTPTGEGRVTCLTWAQRRVQRGLLEVLAARNPVLCAPKAVMKTLMTTVMKTRMVAALLSWFRRHCFSTSLRFSRAVGKWAVRGQGQGQGGGRSPELPSRGPLGFRASGAPRRSTWWKSGQVVATVGDTLPLTDRGGLPRGANRVGTGGLTLGLLRVGV